MGLCELIGNLRWLETQRGVNINRSLEHGFTVSTICSKFITLFSDIDINNLRTRTTNQEIIENSLVAPSGLLTSH